MGLQWGLGRVSIRGLRGLGCLERGPPHSLFSKIVTGGWVVSM